MTDEQLDDLISRMGSVISAFTFNRLKTILTELRDRIEVGGGSGGGGTTTDASDLITGILDNARLQDVPQSKIVNLVEDLAGKALAVHTHSTSQITGLDTALAGKSPTTHTHNTSEVNGLDSALSGKASLSHTHTTSQVTGLDGALTGKAPIVHTHAISDVNNLQTALDAKAPTAHTHNASDIQDFASAVQVAAPAETATQIRDKLTTLSGTARLDASAIKNLPAGGGTGNVESVNGQQGIVSLNQDNISDGTTYKQYSQTDKTKLAGIASAATANSTDAALRDRATHTGVQAISTVTGLQGALDAKVAIDGAKVLSDVNFSTAKDTKLTGIATGATANSSDATLLARANHTGTQSADTLTDGATNKAFTATEKTKLAGVSSGATANSSDATLLARANHTGTQTASTISDFQTQVSANTKLAGIATGATANDTDANLKNRANHTGTQAQSTVVNLVSDLAAKQKANLNIFNVLDYGATGDGTTNDSTAFQNCFNAAILAHGKVIIPSPANFYNITTSIQVYPNAASTGADNEVNIDVEATGTPRFLIKYSGTTGTSCFDINGLRYSKWSGVSVLLADTTNLIGFDLDTKSAASSLSNNAFTSCNVILGNATGQTGWRVGQTGANGGDFSTLIWINSQVYGFNKSVTGTIGWHVKGSNALQNKWENCFGANLDKAYSNSGGGNGGVTFDSFGTSQCNLDFEIANNQSYSWNNPRLESGKRVVHVTNSNVSPSLTFFGGEVNDYTPSDGILFYMDMPCSLMLLGVNIQTGPTATAYGANMIKLYGGGNGTGRGRLTVIGGSIEATDPFYDHSGNNTDWDVVILNVGLQNSVGVNTGMFANFPAFGGTTTTDASLLTSGILPNARLASVPVSAIATADKQTLDVTTLATLTDAKTEIISVALSDLATPITAGTNKAYFRMPFAGTLTAVKATALTASTGSTIVIDVNEAGTSVLSTKLSIDASEKTSATAAVAAVISDAALANDAEITFDFDQVGSTIAGAGVIVYLTVVRA